MSTPVPPATTHMAVESPVTTVRRAIFMVNSKIGLSAWFYYGIAVGTVLLISGNFLPKGFFDLAPFLGTFAIIVALMSIIIGIGNSNMLEREERASDAVTLMTQGISNPARHRKQNPELVAAYESLAIELGASPDPLVRRTEKSHQYDAALLVLSGIVAPEDSSLIVAAVSRGVTDADEIVSIVNEMKANGYALADGAL